MKRVIAVLFAGFYALAGVAQEDLNYYLPDDVTYKKEIPTPEEFFNMNVGEWHLTHDQVLFYMKEIASVSERAIIYEYARSHENRPLVHLVFSTRENQQKLDELKELHYNFSEPGSEIPSDGVPLVVGLTYGVHGNESSATNSSVLTAYYLAAAEGEKIDNLLNSTIIIIDPCLNPDGFVRHSTWANVNQGINDTGSSDSRQLQEFWPGGRTNHYWFDLNRDYLLLVNPESQGRVAKFHEWKPNIVTDHHEMSGNATFFFQPGVPSRNNPLTPERNYELTHEIAKYHARFLDNIGSPYYSEERFDDYYFGKGSSYPDVNGSIGILFEQAGFRGRIRQTSNGVKKFAFGIRNQFTVTLSTLEAAVNLRNELLDMQKEFFNSALDLAGKNKTKAYVFGTETDKIKTQLFIELLNRHQIKVFKNSQTLSVDGKEFKAESSYIVPVKQKQFRLLTSLFEEVASFSDTTFYDVSTWTMPYTFGIPFARLHSEKELQVSSEPVQPEMIAGKVIGGKSSLGYLFRWNEFSAPTALYTLQNHGLRCKVATEKLGFEIAGREENFSCGTILVQASNQRLNPDNIYNLVSQVAVKTGIDFYGLKTGLSPKGIDAGSDSFEHLEKPEILLFAGEGANSRDAGEIWHLFDQRYQIPVTLAQPASIGSIDLNKYNTIILPGGYFSGWRSSDVQKLKSWLTNGGNLIAYEGSAGWAARNDMGKTKFKKPAEQDTTRYLTYAEQSKERSYNYISGTIFNTKLDLSHPLCYGYLNDELAVFKTGTGVAEPLGVKYAEPVTFTSEPYISGWVSPENLERIKNAPVVSVQSEGRGNLISYHENMNFRGIWLGTSKLFSNSVFFGGVIR